jgi:ABC-type uncharacterized transport system YnjBCD ATPase subunit
MKHTSYGFFLFQKDQTQTIVLKDMLRYLKTQQRGKTISFTYVESEGSLMPHLSLWENLHVVNNDINWNDLKKTLAPEWTQMIGLIQHPDCLASRASSWERMATSLLKANLTNSPFVLVDINEQLYSSFDLELIKKVLLSLAQTRQVYMASSNTSLWLEHSQSLVKVDGHGFKILDAANIMAMLKNQQVA